LQALSSSTSGDAHIGAVLARQAEDRVDVGARQSSWRFVGHFAPGAVRQWVRLPCCPQGA
jgi:hypothetical protein